MGEAIHDVETLTEYAVCPRYYYWKHVEKPLVLMPVDMAARIALEHSLKATLRENLGHDEHWALFTEYFNELLVTANAKSCHPEIARRIARTVIGVFHHVDKPYWPPAPWSESSTEVVEVLGRKYLVNIYARVGKLFIVKNSLCRRLPKTQMDIEQSLLHIANPDREIWSLWVPSIRGSLRLTPYSHRAFKAHLVHMLQDALEGIRLGFFPRIGMDSALCTKRMCEYFHLCIRKASLNKGRQRK